MFLIQTTRLEKGKYLIARSDGRQFKVLKGEAVSGWIVESQDTLKVDGFATLQTVKYAIAQCWTPDYKMIGKQL